MDTLNQLKKLLEGESIKKEDPALEREKRFIHDVAVCLGDVPGESAIKNYDPDKMLTLLRIPTKELQAKLGGEWNTMDENTFRLFVYGMQQKIEKSTSLMKWY